MALPPGHLTPFVRDSLVRLGTWMSFAQAAHELGHYARVSVSATTARRVTEQAGAAYAAVQSAQVDQIMHDLPPAPPGPPVQHLSVDGALVPLVGGTWAEVKTLALGTVQQRPPTTKRERASAVHTADLSYFSRLADHETFARLALVETHRRGTETAGMVCALVDGACWCQDFIDLHRPDAVRILDWPHALSYVAAAGAAVYGADTPACTAWLAQQRRTLLEEDPAPVLQTLQTLQTDLTAVASGAQRVLVWTLPAEQPGTAPWSGVLGQEAAQQAVAVVQESLTYLEPRQAQMRYAAFRAAGYPIGSGSVESANKLLVEARLKGAGMHWARAHVSPMVALRTVAYADRWAEAWPQITTHLRQQARTATTTRRTVRVSACQPVPVPRVDGPLAPPPPMAAAGTPVAAIPPPRACRAPTRRRPHKPAADHPWRRMSIGRTGAP